MKDKKVETFGLLWTELHFFGRNKFILILSLPLFFTFFLPLYSLDMIILGDGKAKTSWLYLSGLLEEFESSFDHDNFSKLNEIGKELNIKIMALWPPKRCSSFNNKLCWPHQNEFELMETYAYITSELKHECLSGYLGFSNGGFYLLALAQKVSLKVPIIAIGAGGRITEAQVKNQITLLIGKQDLLHYESAKQFLLQSKHTPLKVNLIEYENGHEIPKNLLYDLIKKFDHEEHKELKG